MPGQKTTLESYVDNVDALDGSDYGGANDEVDNSTDVDSGTDVGGADDSDRSHDNRGQRSDDRNSDDPLVKESKRTRETDDKNTQPTDEHLRPLPNGLLQDANGNLIHPQTRQIVARGGLERRLYERGARLEASVRQKDTQIAQLRQQLEGTQALNGMPKQLGITDDDLRVGLPIVAEFVKNPVEAAKKIIEMVVSMGHNVSDILGQGTDTVEMRGISRMIDERLAPVRELTQQRQQVRNDEELNAQAQEGVQKFFDKHENAEMHADVINNMMGQAIDRGESPDPVQTYYALRVWCAENGLDFDKPLAPQVQNLRARQQNDTVTPTRTTQRSMPNGRAQPARTMDEPETFEAGTGWEDIIKSAMRN